MNKRFLSVFALVLCLCMLLCSCAKGNKYDLSYVSDGSNSQYYIHFNDDREVYVVGGRMTCEIEEESYDLESALTEGKIALGDILASAAEDAEKDRISSQTYNDGSVEYGYDGFRLVVLNSPTDNDIYFLPTDMNYYSLVG